MRIKPPLILHRSTKICIDIYRLKFKLIGIDSHRSAKIFIMSVIRVYFFDVHVLGFITQGLNSHVRCFTPETTIKATTNFGVIQTLPQFLYTACHLRISNSTSVENSYRPVARDYLVLGSGNLLPQVGSPGGRPKIAISQLLDVTQQTITTEIGM